MSGPNVLLCCSQILRDWNNLKHSETFHLVNQVALIWLTAFLSNCFNYLKSFSSLRSAVAEECGIGATWRKRKVQSWHTGHGTWEFDGLSGLASNDETMKRWNGAVETSSLCEMWNNVRHCKTFFTEQILEIGDTLGCNTALEEAQMHVRSSQMPSRKWSCRVMPELCDFLNVSNKLVSTYLNCVAFFAWCSRWKPVKTKRATALTVFGESHGPDWIERRI